MQRLLVYVQVFSKYEHTFFRSMVQEPIVIGCKCTGKARIVAEITGYHPPENGCDFSRYMCPICGIRKRYRSWLNNHIRDTHRGYK